MSTVLITGANRGIGLGLARHYAGAGDTVIATARDPARATELKSLGGKVEVHALDVTSAQSVAALKAELAGRAIDILINNAGIAGPAHQTADDIDYDGWTTTLETNTQGPIRVALALRENVAAAKGKILTVTSGMGSIGALTSAWTDFYAYRSSKSAVNMAMRLLAFDLAKQGISVAVINPGWVRTDLGGPQAQLSVEESAAGIARQIAGLTPEKAGSFLSYDGAVLPW
jgi:NAD(P)-dependent dehydrogenase (short-subunit alcohol dehydrogenase family)